MRKIMGKCRRAAAMLLAAGLLLACCGCGAGAETGSAAETQSAEPLPEATGSLVLYAGPYVAQYLNQAVKAFQKQYPEVDVQVRDFGDAKDYQNEENYMEVLKSDLAAGEGPDLILFTPDELGDIQKTAESGVLQNLDGYFAGDASFCFDGYVQSVLDAGVIGGSRLYMPLSYTVNILITGEDALAATNQTLPITMEELFQQMKSFGAAYRNDTGKYFAQWPDLFAVLLTSAGSSLVDYGTKTVFTDSSSFRSFAEAYRELYTIDHARGEENQYIIAPDAVYGMAEPVLLVRDGKTLYDWVDSAYMFSAGYSIFLYDQKPVYTAVMTENEKPAAAVGVAAAINKNGANKANAYALMKILLSQDLQSYAAETACSYFSFPVFMKSLNEMLFLNNVKYNGWVSETEGCGSVALSPEQIEGFESFVTDVDCVHLSGAVSNFVWDEMQPYFKGLASYDECVKSLKNKLELYVSE